MFCELGWGGVAQAKLDKGVHGCPLTCGPSSIQLEGDTITLKPRPSTELTNSSAPSPSHKVQRSVSANPKQRRFSDQGQCWGPQAGAGPWSCHSCTAFLS